MWVKGGMTEMSLHGTAQVSLKNRKRWEGGSHLAGVSVRFWAYPDMPSSIAGMVYIPEGT